MNRGDNFCGESSDRCLEGGGASSTMGSGIVAYKGWVWDGGEAGGVISIPYSLGGHR